MLQKLLNQIFLHHAFQYKELNQKGKIKSLFWKPFTLYYIDDNRVWPYMPKQSRETAKSLNIIWGNSGNLQTVSQEKRKRDTAITAVMGKQ